MNEEKIKINVVMDTVADMAYDMEMAMDTAMDVALTMAMGGYEVEGYCSCFDISDLEEIK